MEEHKRVDVDYEVHDDNLAIAALDGAL